MNRENIEKKN